MAETVSSVVLINGQRPSIGQHVTFTGAITTKLEIEEDGKEKKQNLVLDDIGIFFFYFQALCSHIFSSISNSNFQEITMEECQFFSVQFGSLKVFWLGFIHCPERQ